MSDTNTNRAVFLSYASQDANAAMDLAQSLRAAGIEVWFDQSELRGGDAWDALIRKQIKGCRLFIPLISRNTQAREEGYFRLEWKLAVDRSHLMASSKTFLLPVVIDDSADDDPTVPDRFRELQWTRLPGGHAPTEFIGRVRQLLGLEADAAPTAAEVATATRGMPAVHQSRRSGSLARKSGLAATALVLMAGCFGIYSLIHSRRGGDLSAPSSANGHAPGLAAANAIPEKSIAVLPFVDLSERKDQQYFSDGLAEELLDMLAQVRDLQVAARTSSFYFKDKSEDIATIAQKLRVAQILEGSVRRSGDVIRVSAQLIRADNGYNLWSKTYDRQIKDIFKVQDEIAGSVVDALKIQLLPSQQIANRHYTSNTEAYRQFLLGNAFRTIDSRESNPKALTAYTQAVALDPQFAAAYSGLSDAEWRNADQTTGEQAAYSRSLAAAEKAIALAPDAPEGYWARGQLENVYDYDWNAAQRDYQKALVLDPTFTHGKVEYALLLATLGRSSDATALLREALRLDPLSVDALRRLAWVLLNSGQIDEARTTARRIMEVNPTANDRGLNGFVDLLDGRPTEALAKFRLRTSSISGQGEAMAEYTLGHKEEADRALADFVRTGGLPFSYQIAEIYAWRGENDKAFEWLDTCYRIHDGGLAYLSYDRVLDGLRKDPRFSALLRKMKLPL